MTVSDSCTSVPVIGDNSHGNVLPVSASDHRQENDRPWSMRLEVPRIAKFA